jgi:rhamnulokinase
MVLEEIHRFPNGMEQKNGQLCWNVEQLFSELLTGMKKCKEIGKIPVSMGIDTWAVDYVLLDENDHMLGNAVGYRDKRTKGADEAVYQVLSEKELYGRTGIQKQMFNTIYQLAAVKRDRPETLAAAKSLLMIPEYFNFRLTGKMAAEYTNATTTQLVDPETKDWDFDLIEKLGYPKQIFREIKKPGTVLSSLAEHIRKEVGFDCQVVLPATHDTGSAVMAVPTDREDTVYISSGTWSLMGTERMRADCSAASMEHNFTNEGGYDYRFRYLKNIMGLWMIQSVQKELAPGQSFGEICERASQCKITSLVDCNDDRFLAPENMTREIQKACEETRQQVPEGIAEVAAVIYNSLAKCYADTKKELEELTGTHYDSIHVVGGGANAAYLNELTAKACGCTVYAGPTEATAIGNLAAQMIAGQELGGLTEARKCIFDSFEIKVYEP